MPPCYDQRKQTACRNMEITPEPPPRRLREDSSTVFRASASHVRAIARDKDLRRTEGPSTNGERAKFRRPHKESRTSATSTSGLTPDERANECPLLLRFQGCDVPAFY